MSARRSGDEALAVLKGLWQLFHALEVRSKWMHRSIGVTGPQRLVIRVVGERPGVTAGEVSDALSIHASTLTGILSRLQEAGLITRRADAADRRRARFRLTAKGRRIDAQRRGTVEAAVREVVSEVPADAVGEYQRVVSLLVRALLRAD